MAAIAERDYDHQASGPRTEYGPGSRTPVAHANERLGGLATALRGLRFELVESETEIRERAERFARLCQYGGRLEGMRELARAEGIEPPTGPNMTRAGELARLTCPRWWRRKLRAMLGQRAENGLRAFGYVRKGRAPYVSDFSVRRRQGQKARNQRAMEAAVLENAEGEQLPLIDIVAGSISNPRIRRGEFMTRARGFNEIADELGHAAVFITATAPSAFHPQLAAGGANPKFDQKACGTVQLARAWLQKMWARTRAKLKRLKVQIYGFRISEPHHDGTPHWHLLLFGTPAALETTEYVMRHTWLSEYGHEPGAREKRLEAKTIDTGAGSAVGYIAKYVSKNIDGHAMGEGDQGDHESGTSGQDGALRVDAWASTHRIRQFQQIGGPPVGLWRELRRLRNPVAAADIEAAREAADRGDWRAFVAAVGGIGAGRKTTVQVWTETTGELTAYGELRAPAPAGVTGSAARLRTRRGGWRIRWNQGKWAGPGRSLSHLGPVAITVRGPNDKHGHQEQTNTIQGDGGRRRRRAKPPESGKRANDDRD